MKNFNIEKSRQFYELIYEGNVSEESYRKLLEEGADPNWLCDLTTPSFSLLECFVRQLFNRDTYNPYVLPLLVEYGVNANRENEAGENLLNEIVNFFYDKETLSLAITLLLESGVNPYAENKANTDALDISFKHANEYLGLGNALIIMRHRLPTNLVKIEKYLSIVEEKLDNTQSAELLGDIKGLLIIAKEKALLNENTPSTENAHAQKSSFKI